MRKKLCNFLLVLAGICILPNVTTYAKDSDYCSKYVLGVGEETLLDEDGVEDEILSWQCDDEEIVEVMEEGEVKALETGTATISGLDENGNVLREYTVKVKAAPESISVSKDKIAEFPDNKVDLEAKVNAGAYSSKITFKSSNSKVASVDSKGIVKLKKSGNATITASVYNGVKKEIAVRVKDPNKVVALTFDDGPVHANTLKLMKALKKYDYHVTFFMVGTNVGGNKDVLKKMVKQGHELGTHTWNHPNLAKMSEANIKKNIQKSRKAIYDACGQYPTVLRPPYGSKNATVLKVCKSYDLPVIMWNVDITDWRDRNAATVKTRILNQVHPGAVFVLHDLHATTVEGVSQALPELQKKGYEVVTVTELAKLKGKGLKAGEVFSGTSK